MSVCLSKCNGYKVYPNFLDILHSVNSMKILYSSRRKRKQLKKASYEHLSVQADFHPNDDEDSETEIVVERVPILNQESLSSAVVHTSLAVQHVSEKEISGLTAPGETEPSVK